MRTLLMLVILAIGSANVEAAWRVSKVSPYLVVKYTGKGIGIASLALARHV